VGFYHVTEHLHEALGAAYGENAGDVAAKASVLPWYLSVGTATAWGTPKRKPGVYRLVQGWQRQPARPW
jgi:hypothetical protein